jgi:hypothetical protein
MGILNSPFRLPNERELPEAFLGVRWSSAASTELAEVRFAFLARSSLGEEKQSGGGPPHSKAFGSLNRNALLKITLVGSHKWEWRAG